MERRLAAILVADVVGYTSLMGADEGGTLKRLTELREDILEPLIAGHHGRIVKLMGDGMLMEFGSVVDAVVCALAWQQKIAENEIKHDADAQFQFRFGINLGEVIVQGGDIHGDAVNIAARLESLAEPGCICLSGDAYRQARGKTDPRLRAFQSGNRLPKIADEDSAYPRFSPNSNACCISPIAPFRPHSRPQHDR